MKEYVTIVEESETIEIYSEDTNINRQLNVIPHFSNNFPLNIYVAHETQKMQSLFTIFESSNFRPDIALIVLHS